jgi:hypothetical protein
MRGHRSGQKTEWFSRLRFGASGRTSRRRSAAFDGHAQSTRTGASDALVGDSPRSYERVQRENLEADTRLKELQAEALEDERELLPQNAEIRRGLSLAGVVLCGGVLVAGAVLGIADPGLNQFSPSFFELCRFLLGK